MPLPAPAPLPPRKSSRKNDLWFVLGQNPLLSAAEIAAVLTLTPTDFTLLENEKILRANKDLPAEELINKIGGTIKIARGIGNDLTEKKLFEVITDDLKQHNGKIIFGISYHGQKTGNAATFGKKIKLELKNEGLSVRHVFNNEPILSSVSVQKNGLLRKGGDFLILECTNGNFDVAKTLAVQPFENFGERDYGRPGRDDKSGMLPPKLAMIMINLAQTKKDDFILDPFCGSGTIITEAWLLGYKNLIGSDISAKAIEDTKKNIEWQTKISNIQYPILDIKIFNIDATKLSTKLQNASVNAIITEPLLGKPLRGNETETELIDQANELRMLYVAAFKEFYKILKPKGKVIFIIPQFKHRNGWVKIDMINEIKKLGFSSKPLLQYQQKTFFSLPYWRSNQFVKREIFCFEK